MNELKESPNGDGDLDLRALFGILWASRWLIALATLVCAVLFTAAAFVIKPVYRAEVALAPVDSTGASGGLGAALGQLGGLAAIAGLDLNAKSAATEEALAVLGSRDFTESFLRDNNLLPLLFARHWDAALKRWKGDAEHQPTLAAGHRYFNRSVRKITQDKKRGLVIVRIEWTDPAQAAQWANAIVARLNEEMRSRARAQTDASVGYLEKELAATSILEVRIAVGRLMEAQINKRMYANVTREYAFRVVDRALTPDKEDIVRPNKPLMLFLGAFVGLFLGIFGAFMRWSWRASAGSKAPGSLSRSVET